MHIGSENERMRERVLLQVVALASGLMLTSAMLRVNFAAVAPTIAADLGLSMTQLSYVHTAFLAGYFLGHLPAGLLADRVGGARVLCLAGLAWALVTVAHMSLQYCPSTLVLPLLSVLRFGVGVTTAAAIPALAAALAQGLPLAKRSAAMSTCYGAMLVWRHHAHTSDLLASDLYGCTRMFTTHVSTRQATAPPALTLTRYVTITRMHAHEATYQH
jgi:sugar phosphate permease